MSNMIYKKMNEVMKEIKSVGKDQTNTMQGFKFRGIDQFVNALYPALTKHGVFMVPSLVNESHELKDVVRSNGKTAVDKHVHISMSYTFYAEDGSNVVVGPIPAEGLDSGDKATNKALSAALKYALIQTFSVPTVDMAEGDLDSPEIGVTNVPPPSNVVVLSPPTEPTVASVAATSTPAKRTSTFRKAPFKKAVTNSVTNGVANGVATPVAETTTPPEGEWN